MRASVQGGEVDWFRSEKKGSGFRGSGFSIQGEGFDSPTCRCCCCRRCWPLTGGEGPLLRLLRVLTAGRLEREQ